MKPKHTRGPWVAEKKVDPAKFWVRAASGQVIAYVPDNPRSQYKANAALISAAPEMLEALELALGELLQYDDSNEPGGPMEWGRLKAIRLAEKAIAKAEGRSE